MTEPGERPGKTSRELLVELLRQGPATIKDLSVQARLSEAVVSGHLEHLAKSVRAKGERFLVEPPTCHECGFVFEGREKGRRPSRCPECRSGRVSLPKFEIR